MSNQIGAVARRRVCAALTVIIGLSPVATRAGEIIFFCHDDKGASSDLKIDITRKRVTAISGRSPYRCIFQLQDGAYGSVYSAPEGETCPYGASGQQFVSISGEVVTFSVKKPDVTSTATLDMQTGVLESPVDTEECHRAHA